MTLRGIAQGAGSGTGTVTHTGALTANAVVVGNGVDDVKALAALGTSGWVLTSGGAGVPPAFAALPAGASTWDTIGAAAGSATTANGTNNIVYNTAPTADSKVAWTFGETSAATNGTSTTGVPNQVLLKLATLAASTQSPLSVFSRGSHVFSVSPTTAQILATTLSTPYSFASDNTSGFDIRSGRPCGIHGGTISVYFDQTGILVQPTGSATVPSVTDWNSSTTGLNWFGGSRTMSVVDSAGGELMRWVGATNVRYFTQIGVAFANLPAAANGSQLYCSDCDEPALVDVTCTSAGTKTGAFAKRLNGAWKCS